MTVLAVVAVWMLLSIPVSLFVGKFIRAGGSTE